LTGLPALNFLVADVLSVVAYKAFWVGAQTNRLEIHLIPYFSMNPFRMSSHLCSATTAGVIRKGCIFESLVYYKSDKMTKNGK